MKKHRILVMSHAHPDFSLGGGEMAAYNLFNAYRRNPDVEDSWFLARTDRQRGATGSISKRRSNEYLWEQGVGDWHRMNAANLESIVTGFSDMIHAMRPTIVHAHHYAHLGLEYLLAIKRIDPNIKIVLTLHEYMAICQNNGQMMKVGTSSLCSYSSPDDCRQCFPERSREDFWLRKHRFIRFFDLIDCFVSPSNFLRQRYIDWGIPKDKIVVIENGQRDDCYIEPRALPEGASRNRFGYFGQVNQFKGLDILLAALHKLNEQDQGAIQLEIHGANLELQPHDFREKIQKLLRPLVKVGNVQWVGPYRPEELHERMSGVDWVCVPSVWWENSPMVIQEAFSVGRPLLVSNIGGMAEKVAHEVNGLHVRAGNAWAWTDALLRAAKENDLWVKCRSGIRPPLSHDECVRLHLAAIQGQKIGSTFC